MRSQSPQSGLPARIGVERDGLHVAALDWGGEGMPLLLLHPNGMGAGFFEPLAFAVRDAFRPVAVDLRGHGGTDTPPTRAGFGFAEMATDVLAVLDHLGIDQVVAVGESLGGGVSVLVDEQRPGVIGRLLLCEPVAFSPDGRTLRPAGTGHGDGGNYMSTIARRRRAVWPDRDAVYESYRSRPPFDVVAPEALSAYVRWGFVDRPDGQIELACAPEVEATIFEVSGELIGAPAAWAHLGKLTADAVLACGAQSELPAEWFAAQAEHAGASLVKLSGGHFFLQEDTARAARLVRNHLTGDHRLT
jgi:pimeloyl-ACP methyl ester carboxylesterase